MSEGSLGVELDQRRERSFPKPLFPEIQPLKTELEPFIPKAKLYFRPWLPHHGQLHGEETMVLTAIILNQVTADVLKRRGESTAQEFLDRIDKKSLLYAAAYHDCARMGDWPVWRNTVMDWPIMSPVRFRYGPPLTKLSKWNIESKRHGPRGAEIITEPRQINEIDPTLTPEQIESMRKIIYHHTSSPRDGIKRKIEERQFEKGKRNIEDYEDPDELMLRIMQEADSLALERTWFSHPSYGRLLDPLVAKIRDKKATSDDPRSIGTLLFPTTRELVPIARTHAWMNRLDPEVQKLFPGEHKEGIALETGVRLGMLKTA